MWKEADIKLSFQHALVWHLPAPSCQQPAATSAPACKPARTPTPFNVADKLGSKSCEVYNCDGCMSVDKHPKDLHGCAYCLASVNPVCTHQKKYCYRKQYLAAKNAKGVGYCQTHPFGCFKVHKLHSLKDTVTGYHQNIVNPALFPFLTSFPWLPCTVWRHNPWPGRMPRFSRLILSATLGQLHAPLMHLGRTASKLQIHHQCQL